MFLGTCLVFCVLNARICLLQIIIDSDEIKQSELTTPEVLACCEDVKVLGKREIR